MVSKLGQVKGGEMVKLSETETGSKTATMTEDEIAKVRMMSKAMTMVFQRLMVVMIRSGHCLDAERV